MCAACTDGGFWLLRLARRIPLPRSAMARKAPAAAFALALLVAAPAALTAKPELGAIEPQTIQINARPLPFDDESPDRRRFGALTWLGSVQLSSPARSFGGLSGLALDATGTRLLAISDAGLWLTGTLTYDGARVTGLADARIGSLMGADGTALTGIKESDAEALAITTPGRLGGSVYVGFERHHRIGVFPITADGLGPAKSYLTLPKGVREATPNSGIEGLTVLGSGPLKGTLVAFSENLTDRNGNHRGWLIGGKAPGPIALKRLDSFSVTDLAALPDGDLLVLERHFSWASGVRMRIRRIKAKDIRPGALLDGEVLIEAGPALLIDNMEAMAVHRGPRGETIITLLSDDNYSPLQRTLLIQFRLDETEPR